MNVSQTKRNIHLQEWSKLIQTQKSSGLPVRGWCKQNDIKTSTYYYWLRELRKEMLKELPEPAKSESFPTSFVEVNPVLISQENSSSSMLEFTKANAFLQIGAISVGLTNQASEKLITNLIRGIRHV